MTGLAFGPTGPSGPTESALYVAGRAPIVLDGVPPGRLYISRDGGGSWQPAVHSPATGPSYRCLEFTGGKLYACGGGEVAGEAFLVGVSEDEGKTWTPVVRLADVHGPRACVRDRCLRTELWLCEGYGQCAGSDGGAPRDGAVTDAGAAGRDAGADAASERPGGPADEGGCACAIGPSPRGPAAPLLLLWAVLIAARLRRRNKSPG
jgi:MYXO-CTERM domain-containing protein